MSTEPPFCLTPQQALTEAGIDAGQGLSHSETLRRRELFGANELVEQAPQPAWKKFLAQFKELVIWILIGAALIAGVLGEWVDTLAILAIVLLNAVFGFFQERHAEQAMSALKKLSAPMAKVRRDGVVQQLPARELVPGDLVEIEAGDNVPADARLIQASSITVQEAALTGESVPVEKEADIVLTGDALLADRLNMLYLGTVVATGKGTALVTATGMKTELGRIAGMLAHQEAEPTPLQKRLAELGRILIVVCVAIVGVVFLLQLSRGGRFVDALLVSVSLAVAAVPEGLPAVVTIALALGLQRMVKRNALVRKLASVETLGSVSVICSDKTGTLTRNEMTVKVIVTNTATYTVTGTGYLPRGEFIRVTDGSGLTEAEPSDPVADRVDPQTDPDLLEVLRIGARCNGAHLSPRPSGEGDWQVTGDPTEGALLVAAMKGNFNLSSRTADLIYELPFDSTRKIMSVAVREAGRPMLFSKGAAESILAKCDRVQRYGTVESLHEEDRQQILSTTLALSSQALRVLAVAYRPNPPFPGDAEVESELVFCGLVGMIDPPREEAKAAIRTCRNAGIRPVMITGDHPATALAIGKELGLITAEERALSGSDLEQMSDGELEQIVEDIAVYSRTTARDKLRIVRAWRSRGDVVAMTGDGVNDAPAIKAADIGIAMGITGSDVTKEASAMILMDDNFASIVSAVEEGRGIYDNIRKALLFLLSCNFGEILLMLIASLMGWPVPLLPVQLLWINLVTDGLPALALSLEPPEPGVMNRSPRGSNESILGWQLGVTIAMQGSLIAFVGIIAFWFSLRHDPSDVAGARAMTFCVIVYAELLRALAARSQTLTWGELGFWSNPHLLLAVVVSGMLQVSIAIVPFAERIFAIPSHTRLEWLVIVVLALTPVTLIEIAKLIRRKLRSKRSKAKEAA